MRLALLIPLLAACNAKLGEPIGSHVAGDDAGVDSPIHSIDALGPDAKVCTGGDAHGSDAAGDCYLFFTGPASYPEAKAACVAANTRFAKITNAAQNAVVAQLSAGIDSFIGATDGVTEGTFLWDDGTPLTYTNFRTGEPNNGSGQYQEDCLVLSGVKSVDMWDDRPCTTNIVAGAGAYSYVCQY